jgi:hypothetical protein
MENYRINLSENKRSARLILCFSLMVLLNAPSIIAQEHLPNKKKDKCSFYHSSGAPAKQKEGFP